MPPRVKYKRIKDKRQKSATQNVCFVMNTGHELKHDRVLVRRCACAIGDAAGPNWKDVTIRNDISWHVQCSQGVTGIVFTIGVWPNANVTSFGLTDRCTSSFQSTVTYINATRELTFSNGAWLINPCRYMSSKFTGTLDPSGSVFSGVILYAATYHSARHRADVLQQPTPRHAMPFVPNASRMVSFATLPMTFDYCCATCWGDPTCKSFQFDSKFQSCVIYESYAGLARLTTTTVGEVPLRSCDSCWNDNTQTCGCDTTLDGPPSIQDDGLPSSCPTDEPQTFMPATTYAAVVGLNSTEIFGIVIGVLCAVCCALGVVVTFCKLSGGGGGSRSRLGGGSSSGGSSAPTAKPKCGVCSGHGSTHCRSCNGGQVHSHYDAQGNSRNKQCGVCFGKTKISCGHCLGSGTV
jgi:hypothetical protein